jgi:uncharacterized protein YggU (UPF0235/DUF167 family)
MAAVNPKNTAAARDTAAEWGAVVLREGSGGAVAFAVKAQPRAKRAGILGPFASGVRVAVREPAEGGRANEALLRVLAEALAVRPGDLSLVSGAASSRKVVSVRGLARAQVAARLAASFRKNP